MRTDPPSSAGPAGAAGARGAQTSRGRVVIARTQDADGPRRDMRAFLRDLPKAELHVHVEGTLEPELMMELAARNGVALPFRTVEEARAAYEFTDLQSFLDVYYQGCAVLREAEDFADLAWAYLERAHAQRVRHVELFFDPQAHTERGVPFEAVLEGLRHALERARRELDVSGGLILCFLRHLSEDHARATLDLARPHLEHLQGVGLDSSERGNPPGKFRDVFAECRRLGLRTVAHAGEEGPPAYITEALDALEVRRIDHGVRCVEDAAVVERLAAEGVPLTVCPLSNVKLRVFERMDEHTLRRMMEAGLRVTINSDDPAYFGGYVEENFVAVQESFGLSRDEVAALSRHAFEASFLEEDARARLLAELDSYLALDRAA